MASEDQKLLRSDAEGPGNGGRWLRRFRAVHIWILASVLLILTAWALRATASIVIPVVASLFIALAVYPIDHCVRDAMPRGLRWLGHALAMLVVLLVLAGFFGGVFFAAKQAADVMPKLVDEIGAMLPDTDAARATATAESSASPETPTRGAGSAAPAAGSDTAVGESATQGDGSGLDALATIGISTDAFFRRIANQAPQAISGFAQSLLGAAFHTLASLTLIFFLVLLMLIEAPTWHAKIVEILGRRSRLDWQEALDVTARTFRWYLLVRVALGVVTATLYVIWLGALGIELLFSWWVLALLLNFVPTIGSFLAALFPVLFAFVTTDAGTTTAVAAGLLVIEQVMGNFIDPRVQGKQMSISPLVTFFALLFWGWLWGIVGALLAVPLAMLTVIVCAYVPSLRPIALFLSDCRDMESLDLMTHRRAT